jgi:hypothetical protein
MVHDFTALDCFLNNPPISDTAEHDLRTKLFEFVMEAAWLVIKDYHFVSLEEKTSGQMTAGKACAACYEDSHTQSPTLVMKRRRSAA